MSCTMHDVWDGDLLKLEVRLKKMQNLGAVVCGMLDLLIDKTSNLKVRKKLTCFPIVEFRDVLV